jgi:cytochrome c biogenesis protein CcmG/thiol:disulfide interchange protein DsbE
MLRRDWESKVARYISPIAPWTNLPSTGVPVILLLAAVAILTAACGSGGGDETPSTGGEAAVTKTEAPDATNGEEREAAPGFELEVFGNESYTKGDVVKLSDFEGTPVVINFWYPSCPPCRLEMPDFEAASKKHKGDVEFIGIQLLGLDSVQDGQDFSDEFGITYAIGPDADGSIVIGYNVIGFPTTVFLDSEHNIARNWSGVLNAEKLDELIQELLQ